MKKRKQYRPKHVLVNPVGYVMESLKPVSQHEDYLIDLRIKNHGAMAALTQGRATRADLKTITAMNNITVALFSLGFGTQYNDELNAGRAALMSVAERGKLSDHFILRGDEMNALNTLLELHDAQLEVINVKHIEQAIEVVHKAARTGKFQRIGE